MKLSNEWLILEWKKYYFEQKIIIFDVQIPSEDVTLESKKLEVRSQGIIYLIFSYKCGIHGDRNVDYKATNK